MVSVRPTIVAIATPAGGAARALIRLSGARAKELAAELVVPGPATPASGATTAAFAAATAASTAATPAFGERDARRFDGRGVRDVRVFDGRGEQPARLVWMTAPRSYTGEDVVELDVLGAVPLVRALVARLHALGAEPAEPGEFTRRAFENGRLSLEQAEGVLALVEARNEESARAAEALVSGASGGEQARLREELVELVALGVASLDFTEDDAGHVPTEELLRGARRALAGVERFAAVRARRPEERGHARATLAGAPNAGKSSLFNRLAGERALVSPHAGTTRDPLRAELVGSGPGGSALTVELVDTPGLEPGRGEVGNAAQELGHAARRASAVLVWTVDATSAEPERLAAERAELGRAVDVVLAWNKADRADARPLPMGEALARLEVVSAHAVSAESGQGLGELAADLVRRAAAAESGLARELVLRHGRALERAVEELRLASEALASRAPLELAVLHLREALDGLDDLSGRTAPDELLGRIFARFCIGK
ncbi:MAG: 50S ribosome-binding GTPase [Planctomycetes bacterium]|nr:50S ribosome-binding GTPase [Planctomycetota bacterium]